MRVPKMILAVTFMAAILFCAVGCGSNNADLGFTSEDFIRKYNAEIDRLARSQKWDFVAKNFPKLKIINDHHGSASPNPDMSQGVFQFDQTRHYDSLSLHYGKESADAQKIIWLNGSLKTDYFLKEKIHAFFDAVAVAVTSGGKGDAQKISEALNSRLDSPDVFLEDDGIVVAVNNDRAHGEKFFYIATSAVAQSNEQILAVKESAKQEANQLAKVTAEENRRKENEPMPSLAPGEWFNGERFVRQYNAAIDRLAKQDNMDYDPVKLILIYDSEGFGLRKIGLNHYYAGTSLMAVTDTDTCGFINLPNEDKDVSSIYYMGFFDHVPEPYEYAILYASVSAFAQFKDLDFNAMRRLVVNNEGSSIDTVRNGLRLEVRRSVNALEFTITNTTMVGQGN